MKKQEAKKILELYGSGQTNSCIRFARCDADTVKRVEGLSDDKLIDEIKGTYCMIDIQGCYSLRDMQELDLLLAEANSRSQEVKDRVQDFFDNEVPLLK